MSVSPGQRVSKGEPCQICGGYPTMARGRGERCAGFVSSDGWAHCTREEFAHGLEPTRADPPTYAHRLEGECRCGREHGAARSRPIPRPAQRARTDAPDGTPVGAPIRHLIRDLEGRDLARHCRQTIRHADGSTDKRVWWERPGGALGLGGELRPADMLYGAERLATYDAERPLVLCEGEPATDAALGLGLQAVGSVTGAGTVKAPKSIGPRIAQAIAARFATVIVWPDADDEGRAHMAAIRASLEDAHAARVRFLRWPDAPSHGDAADFATNQGATGAAALALVDDEGGPRAANDREFYAVADLPGIVRVTGSKYAMLFEGERRGLYLELGKDRVERVTRWLPVVRETLELRDDDGEPEDRRLTMAVNGDARTVTIAELADGSAWQPFHGATGTGTKAVRDALHNVTLQLAEALTPTVASTRTGWLKRPAGLVFVHADGTAYPPDVCVRMLDVPAWLRDAARPPAEPVSDEAVRAALDFARNVSPAARLCELALAAAARATFYTLRPALGGDVHVGPPASGKTSVAAFARALALRAHWPPPPTATFGATVTAIEASVGREADMVVLVDDFQARGEAERKVLREQLERILRPAANETAMRSRMTREMRERPAYYVRTIPIVTGEDDSPIVGSLWRRLLLYRHAPGDVDTRRCADDFARHAPAYRDLERRLIRFAVELGLEGIVALLEELDAKWTRELALAIPARESASDSILALAGTRLAGAELIARVIPGLEPDALARAVMPALVRHVERQLAKVADQALMTDPRHVLGDVLRRALFERRAYVRPQSGPLALSFPERAETAHGLRRVGPMTLEGSGVPLYHIAGHDALGVRPDDLRQLVANDPLLGGLGPAELGERLEESGAILPPGADGKRSRLAWIDGKAGRFYLLPVAVVFDREPDDDKSRGDDGPSSGAPDEGSPRVEPSAPWLTDGAGEPRFSDESPAPAAGDADTAEIPADWPAHYATWCADAIALGESMGMTTREATARAIAELGAELATERSAPAAGEYPAPSAPSSSSDRVGQGSAPAAVIAPPIAPDEATSRPPTPARAASRWKGAADFAYLDGAELVRRDGTTLELDGDPLAAARAAGIGRLILHRDALAAWPELARRLGKSASADVGDIHLLAPDRASGGAFADVPNARIGAEALAAFERLLAPAELRYSAGAAGEALAFGLHDRTRQGTKLPPALESPMRDARALSRAGEQLNWYRDPSADELAGARYLISADKHATYLAACSSLELGLEELEELEAPAFDSRLPGWWRTSLAAVDGLPPALFSGNWHPTAAVELAYELAKAGLCPAPAIERARVYRKHSRYLEPFYRVMRDARDEGCPLLAEPVRSIVLRAVKASYVIALGGRLQSTATRGYLGTRPDWRTAVIAKSGANIARNAIAVWGAAHRWPIGASVDQLYYLSPNDDPAVALAGLKLGGRTGQWSITASLPLDDDTRAAMETARKRGRAGPLAALVRRRTS